MYLKAQIFFVLLLSIIGLGACRVQDTGGYQRILRAQWPIENIAAVETKGVVIACAGSTIHVIEVSTKTVLKSVKVSQLISSIAESKDDKTVYLGGAQGAMYVLSLDTYEISEFMPKVRPSESSIGALAAGEHRIAHSYGLDKQQLFVIDIRTGSLKTTSVGGSDIKSIVVDDAHDRVFLCTGDRLNPKAEEYVLCLATNSLSTLWRVTIANSSRMAYWAQTNSLVVLEPGKVVLLNADTGAFRQSHSFEDESNSIDKDLSISADGSMVAIARNSSIVFCESGTLRELKRIPDITPFRVCLGDSSVFWVDNMARTDLYCHESITPRSLGSR